MTRKVTVHIDSQTLVLSRQGCTDIGYPVSTALNGRGCEMGSFRTPTGRHRIRLKIGAGYPSGAVFVARRHTGEIFNSTWSAAHPGRDWILSRILWLQGLDPGFNRGGEVDMLRRFIYIHGTADEDRIGTPCSHGCIRMRNADVIELFDQVEVGTLVEIV